jgi:hypothetical protein
MQTIPSITKEAFENHIVQAARAADYENGLAFQIVTFPNLLGRRRIAAKVLTSRY